MTSIHFTNTPIHPERQSGPARLGRMLRGRRHLVLLGVLALGVGAAFHWNWLVAIGAAPLLLSALPCVSMCALGLCMSRMRGSSEDCPIEIGDAAVADSPDETTGSCCFLAADGCSSR